MNYIESLINLVQTNQFLSGGLVLGAITSFIYSLKTVPIFLWNKLKFYLTYKVYLDQSDEIYTTFSQWFADNYPSKFRNIEVRFSRDLNNSPINKEKRRWKLWRFQYIDSNFIFYSRRFIWVSKIRKELNAAKDIFNIFHNSYEISGIFAKEAIEKLCEELLNIKIEEEGGGTISIFTTDKWDNFIKKKTNEIKDFKNIFFKEKEEYLKDLNNFLGIKSLYKSKGISYKRIYLLHGRGGTGKTSIASATAKYLDYDLYLLNPQSIQSDAGFIQLASNVPPNSVVLIEDVDCFLKKRELKNESVSFSTLLNIMDGLYSPTNCIFILTTNKIEELDEALIRKGRVDKIMLIDYPDKEQIENFLSNFYDKKVYLKRNKFDIPMSEIQDIALQFSMEDAIKCIDSKEC